ncbi:MAG TPA: glucose-1-phosphate cytidylyltransferase [Acidimicrobiia bacterium]|jgi:glucose-1-phosphate cytidylyltransferase
MKVAILAGGQGTRLAEETEVRPKPMVEIGGVPILWHIMLHFARYSHTEFVVALGYKGDLIRKYFADYHSNRSNLRVDLSSGSVETHGADSPERWVVDLIETGINTNTGGRIKRLEPFLGGDPFMLTWGDGVSDVDLDALLEFHRSHGKLATVTAVHPPARFGQLGLVGDRVAEVSDRPILDAWINGAFFVLEPGIFEYIEDDSTQWEADPLERLAKDRQLVAYRHQGFWQCMDTVRDKVLLEELWRSGRAPWKTWE